MGYYFFSVGIDAEKLNSAIHSKDESLFNNVVATQTYKHYAKSSGLPQSNLLKNALRALIFDEPLDKTYAYLYGYAFICLSQYLGSELPYQQEIKLWDETDLIDECLKSDFNVDLKMSVTDIILNQLPTLPFDKPEDWPVWGMLSIDQISELMQKIQHINIQEEDIEALEDEDDEEKAFIHMHLAGIKQNLQFCLDNNLAFLSFCH